LSREIESADLRFSNDSVLYFKQKKLWEQGIGSEVDFTNRQAAYDQSTNSLGLAKLRLANTRESLQSQLQQEKNNLSSALNSKKDFTITSKQAVKIYLISKEEGELVLPQEPIGTMGDANDYIIEMSVDEMDIVKLNPGLLTLITLDAYKSEVFEGTVVKVYPQKDLRTQTFRVEAIFKTPPPQLYSGLSGQANIVIQQKENVLSIPRSYLSTGNQVKVDSGIVTVTIGLQSLDRVEILSGLSADMVIHKPEVVK
jgi:HlyD family secretion protein